METLKLKKRRQLPAFLKISKLNFDIKQMQTEYFKLVSCTENKNSSFEQLKKNYGRLNGLTQSFDFSSYQQVDLTLYEPQNDVDFRIRNIFEGTTEKNNYFNEKCYNKRAEICTVFWSEILDSFRSPVTRARFAIMGPYSKISPHVDYDTDFSIRIHIPIFSNPDVIFYVKPVGATDPISMCMAADGSAYFLNQGHLHWVENNSAHERVHLVLSVNGQLDLD